MDIVLSAHTPVSGILLWLGEDKFEKVFGVGPFVLYTSNLESGDTTSCSSLWESLRLSDYCYHTTIKFGN